MHRDRTVTLRGLRFHYTAWGDAAAPPLVMLHGITGHARAWDGESRALAGRYRVLALDQRGHGDSDPAPDGDYTTGTLAEDLAAFCEALDLGRPRLLGLSMGGRVAIAYAGRRPARVAAGGFAATFLGAAGAALAGAALALLRRRPAG